MGTFVYMRQSMFFTYEIQLYACICMYLLSYDDNSIAKAFYLPKNTLNKNNNFFLRKSEIDMFGWELLVLTSANLQNTNETRKSVKTNKPKERKQFKN